MEKVKNIVCKKKKKGYDKLKEEERIINLRNKLLNKLNENNYILLTDLDTITKTQDKIVYKCLKHGNIETSIVCVLNNHICKECAKIKRREETRYERVKNISNRLKKLEESDHFKIETDINKINSVDDYVDMICKNGHKTTMRIKNIFFYKRCTCRLCSNMKNKEDSKLSKDEIIKRISKYGGKILNVDDYETTNTNNLKIICPICGKQFITSLGTFTAKNGNHCCEDCSNYKVTKKNMIQRIEKAGGSVKNPDDYIDPYTKNLYVSCPICHKYFLTSLNSFTQHGCQVCEGCRDSESLGEKKIKNYLIKNNIKFEQEKRFDDCKDKYTLPFDFYLPDLNTIIEFDGQQHFEENHFFKHSNIDIIKKHDNIKNLYCKKNNINLLRIPYWDFLNIEKILKKNLTYNI